MKGVEILCPHCSKKIVIPEYMLGEIIEKYQKSKAQEKPPEPEVEKYSEPEIEKPFEEPEIEEVPDEEPSTADFERELMIKKEQLAEVMSKLERNQANLTRVVKRSVKDEDMYRIQKERAILIQEAKNLQDEIAAIEKRLGKPKKKML